MGWLYRRVIGVAGMRAPPVVRGLRRGRGVVVPPFLPGPSCQVGPSPPRSSRVLGPGAFAHWFPCGQSGLVPGWCLRGGIEAKCNALGAPVPGSCTI